MYVCGEDSENVESRTSCSTELAAVKVKYGSSSSTRRSIALLSTFPTCTMRCQMRTTDATATQYCLVRHHERRAHGAQRSVRTCGRLRATSALQGACTGRAHITVLISEVKSHKHVGQADPSNGWHLAGATRKRQGYASRSLSLDPRDNILHTCHSICNTYADIDYAITRRHL